MKVIIAGSRDIHDYETVAEAVAESGFEITTVVSGTQRGVDTLGERWAEEHNIPVQGFDPEDYQDAEKPRFLARNDAMIDYADALIAVWDGESPGTEYTRDAALEEYPSGNVFVWRVDETTRLDGF